MNRLVQDNDGHWYIIKNHEMKLFEEWLEVTDDYSVNNPYDLPLPDYITDFSKNRINSPESILFSSYVDTTKTNNEHEFIEHDWKEI